MTINEKHLYKIGPAIMIISAIVAPILAVIGWHPLAALIVSAMIQASLSLLLTNKPLLTVILIIIATLAAVSLAIIPTTLYESRTLLSEFVVGASLFAALFFVTLFGRHDELTYVRHEKQLPTFSV